MNIHRTRLLTVSVVIAALVGAVYTSPRTDSLEETSSESQLKMSETENQGIDFFHGSFEDALARAAKEQKQIFVDVYTIWCGPCIVMQETVFPLPEVGRFFNSRFVNYKLDAESEEQNGSEIATRYDIGVYPTYLILDHDGNELNRATSALPAEQFISLVSRMLGETSSKFDEMQSRYDSGEKSTDFIQQYLLDATVELSTLEIDNQDIDSVNAHYDEIDKYTAIAREYFQSRGYSELINETDIQLVMYYSANVPRGDALVEFVIDNYDDVLAVSSNAAISQLVLQATKVSVAETAQAGDRRFVEYIEALESKPLSRAVEYERRRDPNSGLLPENLKYSWETQYLLALEDWDGLHEVYKRRFEKSGDTTTAKQFGSAARQLVRSDSPIHREVALKYAKSAYEMDQDDPVVVSSYVRALIGMERQIDASNIHQEYLSGLTESKADKNKRRIFGILTPAELKEDNGTKPAQD